MNPVDPVILSKKSLSAITACWGAPLTLSGGHFSLRDQYLYSHLPTISSAANRSSLTSISTAAPSRISTLCFALL